LKVKIGTKAMIMRDLNFTISSADSSFNKETSDLRCLEFRITDQMNLRGIYRTSHLTESIFLSANGPFYRIHHIFVNKRSLHKNKTTCNNTLDLL
jgi:hypothetical protein